MSIRTRSVTLYAHSPHHLICSIRRQSEVSRAQQHLLIPIISQHGREDLFYLASIRKLRYWTKLIADLGEETKRNANTSMGMVPRARYLILKFYHAASQHQEYPEWSFDTMLDMLCRFTARMYETRHGESKDIISNVCMRWPSHFDTDLTNFKELDPKPILALDLQTKGQKELQLSGTRGIVYPNGHYEELALNNGIQLSRSDLERALRDSRFKQDDIKDVLRVMGAIPHMAQDTSFQSVLRSATLHAGTKNNASVLIKLMKLWRKKL